LGRLELRDRGNRGMTGQFNLYRLAVGVCDVSKNFMKTGNNVQRRYFVVSLQVDFAKTSAFSLPSIPTRPGAHKNVIEWPESSGSVIRARIKTEKVVDLDLRGSPVIEWIRWIWEWETTKNLIRRKRSDYAKSTDYSISIRRKRKLWVGRGVRQSENYILIVKLELAEMEETVCINGAKFPKLGGRIKRIINRPRRWRSKRHA